MSYILRLYSFLEDYQVTTNTDRRSTKTKHQKFADEIQPVLIDCILSSASRVLSLALLSKPFRCLIYIFSMFLFSSALLNAYSAVVFLPLRGNYFKFVVEHSPNIQKLDGISLEPIFSHESVYCKWPRTYYNKSIQGREQTFAFQNTVRVTGWALREPENEILAGPEGESTRLFNEITITLHQSADGDIWHRLQTRWPTRKSAIYGAVDLRPPVWWILLNVISPLALGICSFAASYMGSRYDGRTGSVLFALGWMLSSVTHLFALLSGAPLSVATSCALSAIYSVLSFAQYRILEGCLAAWSIQLVAALFNSYHRPESLPRLDTEALQNAGLALLAGAIMAWRSLFREGLRSRLRRDQEAFDNASEDIRNDPALPRLSATCKKIIASLHAPEALRQPTRCVRQLWDQAAALRIILDAEAESWALSSCGVAVLADPDCDRPSAVKLFALLDGDASRLFDFCSAGIVFDDVGCLVTCLKLIHADPGVRVLRLENGLGATDTSDRASGSGYRHVVAPLPAGATMCIRE